MGKGGKNTPQLSAPTTCGGPSDDVCDLSLQPQSPSAPPVSLLHYPIFPLHRDLKRLLKVTKVRSEEGDLGLFASVFTVTLGKHLSPPHCEV